MKVAVEQYGVREEWQVYHNVNDIGSLKIERVGGSATIKEQERQKYTFSKIKYLRRKRLSEDVCIILASAPYKDLEGVEILSYAVSLAEALDVENCAGDAKDAFHRQVLNGEMADEYIRKCMPWRIAWKGKVATAIQFLGKFKPSCKSMTLLAIKGGPECDWERDALEKIVTSFQKISPMNISIHDCVDLDDFFNDLDSRSGPK